MMEICLVREFEKNRSVLVRVKGFVLLVFGGGYIVELVIVGVRLNVYNVSLVVEEE